VLNAMDEGERDYFETQLVDYPELRNEVTELTDTAVLLGMAVHPVTPSPALKQKIMARLSQTPQLEREVPPVRALRALPTLTEARTRRYSRPLLAAAAAVVLVAGGVVGTNLAIQGAATSAQASALASIETASDAQRAQAAVSTGGTVTLVWSQQIAKSALLSTGLKVLPGNKTYELWYIDSAGKATPAGLFPSSGQGSYTVLSGHMAPGDTVGVTVEPSGGSKAPTTKPVVAIASA
jgi:anti-sigma-K factor RskA